MNNSKFYSDLTSFKSEVEDDRSKLVKKVATECYRRIKQKTPVNTGAARAAWELKIKKYNAIIENDMPYILKLEHGWSQQAPYGMAALTIAELQNKEFKI